MCKINIEGLSFSYRLTQTVQRFLAKPRIKLIPALNDISATLNSGDKIALLGKNGSGKSTLLKLLAGSIVPSKGTLSIEGERLALLNRGLGLIPKATLRENASIKAASFGLNTNELREFVEASISSAGLSDRSDDPLNSLSAGMAARFNLAINSRIVKPITILDEWIGATGIAQIQKNGLLEKLRNKSEILIFASHNPAFVRELSNRAIVLDCGEIIFDGRNINHAIDLVNVK